MSLKGKNILLGISGGIAAYKMPMVVRLLKKQEANVKVVMTEAAKRFVSELSLATVSEEPIYTDIFPARLDTAADWTQHISLGEWADALVIAPATANTIARLAAGLADDLLTSSFITLRPNRPRLVFPAMDGEMFHSASVQRNLRQLEEDGCKVIAPESGFLASGQCGTGRMPDPERIEEIIEEELGDIGKSLLTGRQVVVTAGPTREKIDGVRFISNYSSGKMGFALACAAARRGAEVVLVSGPVALPTPDRVERIDVESAEEMEEAVTRFHQSCDLFIGAAAVADYRPETFRAGKIKKNNETMDIRLVRNPDILAGFAAQKTPGQLAVGFALETEGNEAYALEKLQAKQLDMIAFNTYDGKSSGFEVDTNQITLFTADGTRTELPVMEKKEAAKRMLDALEKMLEKK
ncbi:MULTISPECIES: bifunctional phosphopantothenoylcysteine decarboxylase/phosphopantothenate--cysteine ligase CoaBC [Prosthecochloris]|uniref:Coenzyme A biosynthesis bifunctional protein CoaBC n=1 Tax=Prosthecochloris vibrioformis TaxID=1098 RepID=A0A5C4RZP4_PROVB|nr:MULTISPECIES: bifunctional phosphopantothenoylcysteine decarboxylase/phosphopantothenate--cysteine ligase CoaBC [Prosthecochloris]ANT64108.1 DNA/pantothenate metabolism flavoprotein [Prosthecochloris sp. CIB 2401]TNJ36398.1 bifunctional phosphopantothenoylcysteine decarboxylase/phosphopantothenate--cysteine ligase CoaBC [Prosthecochloris vibrioformis]